MVGPRRSPTVRSDGDERALAGVVGAVILLALVLTAYGNALRAEVPIAGAEAEAAWARDVARELDHLVASAASFRDDGTPLAVSVPAASSPRSVDWPLLPPVTSDMPSGTLRFQPECASLNATHDLHGRAGRTPDLLNASRGCLTFTLAAVHGSPVSYRVEHGALLRVERDRAVVLRGPQFDLNGTASSVYTVVWGVPGLEGPGASTGVGAIGARVILTPSTVLPEIAGNANAANATWDVDTRFPRAWHEWFAARLDAAGLVSSRPSPGPGESAGDFTLTCTPTDCTRDPASGRGRVQLVIHGPRADRNDIALALPYASIAVTVE